MSALKKQLHSYWETLAGDRLELVAEDTPSLPLFIRDRYQVFSARLFGRKSFLAIEKEGWETGSPAEYRKHSDTLNLLLHEPVVLVLPLLPSYARNRMVQMSTPFIVPGSQTFIPTSLIDLRERFPQPKGKQRHTLSPAAQCTVLYHLLRQPLAEIPLKEIAHHVQYSPMMMTKVKDELEAAGICKIVRRNRSIVLDFPISGRALWEQLMPFLTSPVKKTRWVQWPCPIPSAVPAGISALSRLSIINDDRLPTYALTLRAFQHSLEHGKYVGCPDAETAAARIEVWSYDPRLLSGAPPATVDTLSLYLSLRDSPDERVQQQLEHLIGEVRW